MKPRLRRAYCRLTRRVEWFCSDGEVAGYAPILVEAYWVYCWWRKYHNERKTPFTKVSHAKIRN